MARGLAMGGHKFYILLGLFTFIFIAYLWLAPKLVKKPAGTPPRSGSNEEASQVTRAASGAAPEPVGAPGTTPPAAAAGAGGGGLMTSPISAVGSSNAIGGPLPYNVGGQTSASSVGRVGGYAARIFPGVHKIAYQ